MDFRLPLYNNEDIMLPGSAPSGETVRSFIDGPLLTALNASIDDMDEVLYYVELAESVGINVNTKEIIEKTYFDPAPDNDIEVDEGDYYLFRAGLKAVKAFALIVSAYDLDVDVREIAAMANMDAFNLKTFLDRYPDFLNLLTTGSTPSVDGAGKLAEAKTALMGAIDDYLTASDKIRNDSDTTDGAGEFVEIDDCQLKLEEWFRNNLGALETSLSKGTKYTFNEETENWTFTDGSSNQLHVELLNNMSEGNWYSMNTCDFIGCSGAIECVTISGNQITLKFEGNGPNGWANATLTGDYDSANHTINNGTFNGSDGNGSISGTFTATRTDVTSETKNINLNPLFGSSGGPYNLRDFLPRFNEYGGEIAGTMGYGLNPPDGDPTLGGILPEMTQDDWDLEYGACGLVDIAVVANDSIDVDGNIADWSGISPVFTDESGDDEPDLAGTDIKSFYLAKDDTYLYVGMTLNDGPPNQNVIYTFVAAEQYDEYDLFGERSTEAVYNSGTGNWDSKVTSRGDWQTIGNHPGNASAGSDIIEWKVPLSEMGNLSGKFIRISTNGKYSYRSSDENFTCLRIGPMASISVNVTIPQYDNTGAVYIGVFPFNGTVNTEPENRIGGKIFYPGDYSDGTYTIENLPVGANVIVGVRWDSDYNGLKPGDYSAGAGPVAVAGDGSTSVTLTTGSMIAGSLGEPYFRSCSIMDYQTPSGTLTSIDTVVFDPDGMVPDTISSLTVSGPNGFSYNFTSDDIWNGNEYWAGPTGQPTVGEYVFTVTDEDGKTAISHCYFKGGDTVPMADINTFQATGDYSSPTFSWGAVSGYNGNLFYRVRVFEDNGGSLSTYWTSDFTTTTAISYSGPPLDTNKSYKWRVEAFDNYTFGASNNCSVSSKVDMVIDNETPYFAYALVYNRHDSDGQFYTALETRVIDPDGNLPASILSITVKAPRGNIIYNFTSGDYYSFSQEYYAKITKSPVDGVYEFTVTDSNGFTKTTYDYVKVHNLPFVDSTTLQASGDPLTPTLSWGVPAGIDGSFYYRVIVENQDGSRVWASDSTQFTMVNVPSGKLQSGVSYKWYVRTIDDKNFVHFSNQARSAKVALAIDNAIPYFKWANVYQRRQPGGLFTAFDVSVIDPNGTVPDSIQSLRVTGPNNYSYDFTAQDFINDPTWPAYFVAVPGQLTQGVYTFTVTYNESKTAVNHAWLKTVTDIPGFDETSIRMTGNPTAPTVSWGGISGYQGQLYYRLWVEDMDGKIAYTSQREPYTAQTVPEMQLQANTPYKFRVEAYDHFDWIIYNARSNSNYFSLTTSGGPITTLTGRVTDKQGNPVANVNLYAGSQACGNQWLSSAKTNDYGIYTFYGLPEGNIYIFACASCSDLPYQNGWFGEGSGNCNNATGVFLSQGEHKTDIDFTLYSIGDVNKDGNVDLADAITALKVIAGLQPAGVNFSADVNGDGKIGLAEVIYIIQSIAGLRQ